MKHNNSNAIIPIVTYTDTYRDKSLVLSENNNKSGVYR